MTTSTSNKIFDYKALRLLLGIIAFSLPFLVNLISPTPLTSISASYHTKARDIFVGLLFVVAAFLWAYNGHTIHQARASKVASIAAIFVALFPTTCETCLSNSISSVHYTAAAVLFGTLAYFCFGPFRENIKGQGGKKERRNRIYLACGVVMALCILSIGVGQVAVPEATMKTLKITYWAEAIALEAFGVAWIVAGKILSPLVDEDEALRITLF